MADDYACPHCGSDQRGAPIPEEYLRAGMYGEWSGEARYYMRTIMVEVPRVYDGGLYYQCPECGGRWHRWPEGTPLWHIAELYVNQKR